MKLYLPQNGLNIIETDDGRIQTIEIVQNPDGETIEIGSRNSFEIDNGKAAISAFADYLSHGIYDHELTDKELGTVFVREDAKAKGFFATELGYITRDCTDTRFPAFGPKDGEVAVLHRRAGKFRLGSLSKEGEIKQERYVEWLMAAAQGYNISVRVLPIQDWANAVLENLSIEDHAERLEDRNNRYARRVANDRVRQSVGKGLRRIESGDTRQVTEIAQQGINVRVWGTTDVVNMLELPAMNVLVHRPRGKPTLAYWDASYSALLAFTRIANEKNTEVELNASL